MFEIIYDAVLQGIDEETAADAEFAEWVDAIDDDMKNEDVWEGPNW